MPDADMKEEAKAFCEEKTCGEWRDGYLVVDGSTFELFQKPGHYGETYFDKSSNYSLNAQVSSLGVSIK